MTEGVFPALVIWTDRVRVVSTESLKVSVTRTISFATSNGFGANIAPTMLTTLSKL